MSAQKQMFYSFFFCAFVRVAYYLQRQLHQQTRMLQYDKANKRNNISSNQKQQNHFKHELNLHLVAHKRNENSRGISATNSQWKSMDLPITMCATAVRVDVAKDDGEKKGERKNALIK